MDRIFAARAICTMQGRTVGTLERWKAGTEEITKCIGAGRGGESVLFFEGEGGSGVR